MSPLPFAWFYGCLKVSRLVMQLGQDSILKGEHNLGVRCHLCFTKPLAENAIPDKAFLEPEVGWGRGLPTKAPTSVFSSSSGACAVQISVRPVKIGGTIQEKRDDNYTPIADGLTKYCHTVCWPH